MNKKLNYTDYLMNELYKNITKESKKFEVCSESFFSRMIKMSVKNIGFFIFYMFTLFITLLIPELIKDIKFIILILLILWGVTGYWIYRILKKTSLSEGNFDQSIYTEEYIKKMCTSVSQFLIKHTINSNKVEGLIAHFESKDANNDIDMYNNFERNIPIISAIASIVTAILTYSGKGLPEIFTDLQPNITITIILILLLIAITYFISKYHNDKRRYEEIQKRDSVLDALYLYNIHNKRNEENRRKNVEENKVRTSPKKSGLENFNREEQVEKTRKKRIEKYFLTFCYY